MDDIVILFLIAVGSSLPFSAGFLSVMNGFDLEVMLLLFLGYNSMYLILKALGKQFDYKVHSALYILEAKSLRR